MREGRVAVGGKVAAAAAERDAHGHGVAAGTLIGGVSA